MKLEIGSGDRPTPGFVHLDIRPDAPDVDLIGDATRLTSAYIVFERTGPRTQTRVSPITKPTPGGCEEIRATHVLEHFSHLQTVELLKHWREYLKPSGRLYLEVPNLTGHVNAWRDGDSSDAKFVEYLFGEQDHEFNFHKTMFTEQTLRTSLEQAGLTVISVEDVGLVLCAEAIR